MYVKILNRKDHKNTKIVATIGPATSSKEKLLDLVEAGVDTVRLNFSHGTHQDHEKVIDRVMQINKEYNLHIGILADLQGPKIRVGKIVDGPIELLKDDTVFITSGKMKGVPNELNINYTEFASDVKPGERILLDDGKVALEVIKSDGKERVELVVRHGGPISSYKGINLPDTVLKIPSLTEKDMIDLEYILTQPVNWIALSFVRHHKDVKALRRLIKKQGHIAQIIAKIERPEALLHIDKIIKSSNAIMIARGDLAVELPMEKLPGIQKEIINKCIQAACPVIVATQMMESMITNPGPTRAEITDVANAVLDGTDAVMLSGETAIGKFPVEVVRQMNKIIIEAEKTYTQEGRRPKPTKKSSSFLSDVVCFNAAKTAVEIGASALIGMTYSGYTAFKLSSYRPKLKIFIFSDRQLMLSTLNLVWGVRCYYYDKLSSTDQTIKDVVGILKEYHKIKSGDVVVNTGSMPVHERLRTNMMKVTIVE
jgi:pyruvate kinase